MSEERKHAHKAAERLTLVPATPQTLAEAINENTRAREQQPCPGCAERCGQCAEDALD